MDVLLTPENALEDIWTKLDAGLRNRNSALHLCTLATLSDAGPQARTVVLRKVEPGRLLIHTDVRSPKVREIDVDGRVGVLFYDATLRLQFRLSGQAMVHRGNNPLAQTQWDVSQEMSRVCYSQGTAAGTEIAFPESLGPPVDGRANFAVIEVIIDRAEWLHLYHAAHQRMEAVRRGDRWETRWIAP